MYYLLENLWEFFYEILQGFMSMSDSVDTFISSLVSIFQLIFNALFSVVGFIGTFLEKLVQFFS